jgi:chromosome segregation ATPase
LAEHFVTLDHFQAVEDKLTESLESIILEMNGKFNHFQTQICKINLELQQLHDKTRELEDFCHENDSRLEVYDKDLQLVNKRIVCMKHDIEQHTKEIKRHDDQFDVVQEELNAVKCYKADQEVVDEKADKRDTDRALKRKVSQITFESVRKHLAGDVQTAHDKITRQETIFQQRLMQLSVQVANEREKLEEKCKKSADKITEMCKQLEHSLRVLHEERVAVETAASAAGFQVGLNCLACAENSYMAMTETGVPLAKPFKQHLNQNIRSGTEGEPCGAEAAEPREKID